MPCGANSHHDGIRIPTSIPKNKTHWSVSQCVIIRLESKLRGVATQKGVENALGKKTMISFHFKPY